jgi:hypothetical protein
MKTILICLIALAAGQRVFAQEIIPLDEAQKAARKVTETAIADAPLKTDVDIDKPCVLKADKGGMMIIPDKQLSTEKLAAPGPGIVPIGQLWSLHLSLADSGKPIDTDKLRLVTVTDGDKQRELEVYFLGATKNQGGDLELTVFGKNKEPLFRVPIAKSSATTSSAQKVPIELSGRKNDDDSGTLTLRLLDQYSADLPVVRSARE